MDVNNAGTQLPHPTLEALNNNPDDTCNMIIHPVSILFANIYSIYMPGIYIYSIIYIIEGSSLLIFYQSQEKEVQQLVKAGGRRRGREKEKEKEGDGDGTRP